MDENKLEISGKVNKESPAATATYKPIPETDMEDEAITRPKSLVKVKTSPEGDGADEKMLPKDETMNSNVDYQEAKISPNDRQNGNAKLDIGEVKTAFVGMGKEELMKYANDPFWVRLRWFLFITFWVLWAAMLVGAVLIIYAAPKCDPPPPRTWWQQGPLTELKANTKPDEIKSLDKNIKGVVITWPDDTYAKFNDSHPTVQLIKQAKEQGVNVILELDPAVSNVWFKQSETKVGNFTDYYIWKAGKQSGNGEQQLPNNWISIKNKTSWTLSPTRKEYYYKIFEKPHLNFRNENVTKEFSKVMENFLATGVSGIRIRNAAFLLVDSQFKDMLPNSNAVGLIQTEYGFYYHTNTENLPELAPLFQKWQKVVKNKTENGPFMIAEDLASLNAYKVNDTLVVDLPLQSHIFSKPTLSVKDTVNDLNQIFNVDNITWPLWKANTNAVPKDVLDIVTYLLPGTPLVNSSNPIDLPLLKLREHPSIMRGNCTVQSVQNNTVIAFIRTTPGNPGILVVVNPSLEMAVVNLPRDVPVLSSLSEVTVKMYSKNFNETSFMDVNAKKDAKAVPVSPKSALVLTYVPKTNA